ncbi:XRE family transcriptional regulator [Parafrankia sp. FMc2]|uniref:XRE family transcriptional regulator n=1 Tax=Parafrankia sp. FMc2 TaxID=3233196 RepID=UPI0034D63C80
MFVIQPDHPLPLQESVSESTHPLRRLRSLHGWSYETVARIVAARARELGVASMAAQRQKIWRWENRGVIPDRISQLALARELGVPDQEVTAHPWPAWLPTLGTPSCAQQIATLRGILEQLREVLLTGDSMTAAVLVEEGLTVPVDDLVLDTTLIRSSAVRVAMARAGRHGGPARTGTGHLTVAGRREAEAPRRDLGERAPHGRAVRR